MSAVPQSNRRASPSYTARHRHQLPGRGYTGWSEGVPNGRHNHSIDGARALGYVEDSVGSPVHRHAWNYQTPKGPVHTYTSGPLQERLLAPTLGWLGRVLRR